MSERAAKRARREISKSARRAEEEFAAQIRRLRHELSAEQPIERRDTRRRVLALIALTIIVALLAQIAAGALS